jgi:hypothetical protein
MRWVIPKEPVWGQRRVIRRFALLPITANYERRWLEWVYIEQYYVVSVWEMCWGNNRFVTKENYERFKRKD